VMVATNPVRSGQKMRRIALRGMIG